MKTKPHPSTPLSAKSLSERFCRSEYLPKEVSSFICSLGRRHREDVPHLPDTISSELTARLLTEWKLDQTFGLLCDLPRKGLTTLRVLVCPGCGLPGEGALIEVTADFNRVEMTVMGSNDGFGRSRQHDPAKILKNMPIPIGGRIIARIGADRTANCPAEEEGHTGPLAVIRNPRTEAQWRVRFEADRWFESDILPLDRLTDAFDLRAWLRFYDPAS